MPKPGNRSKGNNRSDGRVNYNRKLYQINFNNVFPKICLSLRT